MSHIFKSEGIENWQDLDKELAWKTWTVPTSLLLKKHVTEKKGRESLLGQRGNKIERKLSHASFSLGNLCTAVQKVHKYLQHWPRTAPARS